MNLKAILSKPQIDLAVSFFLLSSLSRLWWWRSLEYERDHNVKVYVEQVLGGERATRLHILTDFFKHAFDGDGDDGVS